MQHSTAWIQVAPLMVSWSSLARQVSTFLSDPALVAATFASAAWDSLPVLSTLHIRAFLHHCFSIMHLIIGFLLEKEIAGEKEDKEFRKCRTDTNKVMILNGHNSYNLMVHFSPLPHSHPPHLGSAIAKGKILFSLIVEISWNSVYCLSKDLGNLGCCYFFFFFKLSSAIKSICLSCSPWMFLSWHTILWQLLDFSMPSLKVSFQITVSEIWIVEVLCHTGVEILVPEYKMNFRFVCFQPQLSRWAVPDSFLVSVCLRLYHWGQYPGLLMLHGSHSDVTSSV